MEWFEEEGFLFSALRAGATLCSGRLHPELSHQGGPYAHAGLLQHGVVRAAG